MLTQCAAGVSVLPNNDFHRPGARQPLPVYANGAGMTLLGKADVLALLDQKCREAGGVTAFARRHKLSAPYVSAALSGDRTLGPKLLKALRLKRVILYEARK